MFHGQFMTIITSRQTNERSFKFEPFNSINIAVPERGPMEGGPDGKGLISIQDCLDEFFSSEPMTGDSRWESPSAGKVDAMRGVRMWRLPEVLILSMKRFTMAGIKVRTRISYPLTGLDMAAYCTGKALDEGDSIYDLVGIVIHMGVVYGGHYVSIARNPGGEWIVMNDVRVGLIDPDKVRNNPDAYTLVYQKSSLTAKDDIAEAEWFKKHIEETKKASGKSPSTPSGLPSGDDVIEDGDDMGDVPYEDDEFDYVPEEGDVEYDIPPDMVDDE
jgi:ubiquitin C-terminal hydrolase